jgi:hypothetical protein
MQERGDCSHSHPANQEVSSEIALFDENPWGVGMFDNMSIEEVKNVVSETLNLLSSRKNNARKRYLPVCFLAGCTGSCSL